MKTTLQVVENSDRFQAVENGTPFKTFFFSNIASNVRKQDSQHDATLAVTHRAYERINEGYTVIIKPLEVK